LTFWSSGWCFFYWFIYDKRGISIMGKNSKSANQTRQRQYLIVGIVLVVIILGIGGTGILPRISGNTQATSTTVVNNQRVSVDAAYQLYQEEVLTVDVRTPEEWEEGHIPGATLIPLNELVERAGELPKGDPILLYCRSGNRSLQALNLLAAQGFQNLSSMDGGINDWAAAGYPVE
jgi:rhodanese-related sulfurtransferase